MAIESRCHASLLDAQPPEVQEAFQFLLATALHEAGKFELLNVAEIDGRWHYTFSDAGEVFRWEARDEQGDGEKGEGSDAGDT